MSKEVAAIANSPAMWAVTIFALVILVAQSVIFLKKSLEASKVMGIPGKTIKEASKAACVASIGPSLVIVSTLVTLLINVGAPTALMRLSYIGDVRYEVQGATLAAKAYGQDLSPEIMTPEILFCAVGAMGLGCVGFLIFTSLFINKMDTVKNFMVGGKEEMLGIFVCGAVCGAIAYFNAGYVLYPDAKLIAAIVGFVVMTALTIIERKKNIKWIRSWALTIAMFTGMFAAALTGGF